MTTESDNSKSTEHALPAFPELRWVLLAFGVWFLCGIVPILLVLIGNNFFKIADANSAAVAGTIGDAFGLANSFFAAAALLFVIWSIRLQQQEIKFARDEWRENTKSQNDQVEMMRETTELTAINHIYTHYSHDYGKNDDTGILNAIADGHRRWAIRASFSSIDKVFESDRSFQVEREMSQLAELLMVPNCTKDYLCQVSVRVSNLLVDRRADKSFRKSLWALYEIIRLAPEELVDESSITYSAFKSRAKDVVDAWKEVRNQISIKGEPSAKPDSVNLGGADAESTDGAAG